MDRHTREQISRHSTGNRHIHRSAGQSTAPSPEFSCACPVAMRSMGEHTSDCVQCGATESCPRAPLRFSVPLPRRAQTTQRGEPRDAPIAVQKPATAAGTCHRVFSNREGGLSCIVQTQQIRGSCSLTRLPCAFPISLAASLEHRHHTAFRSPRISSSSPLLAPSPLLPSASS
jgi:hypothetical protein